MEVSYNSNTHELTVKTTLDLTGRKSRTGKTRVVATSRGQQPIGVIEGLPTYLQLNVLQSTSEAVATVLKSASNVLTMKNPVRANGGGGRRKAISRRGGVAA